jgi:hypothetical protein
VRPLNYVHQMETSCGHSAISGFPPLRPGFDPRSGHVVFVVDKVALGHVFSENFSCPCQFSFHRLIHIYHHLSSMAGTIGQLVADVPNGSKLTPLHETKRKQKAVSVFPSVSVFQNYVLLVEAVH